MSYLHHIILISIAVMTHSTDYHEIDLNIPINYQSIQNDKHDQLRIPKDQTLIVRLPSNTLLKYTAYKDVSILHFRIPSDTRTAFFTFKAFEESKSAFRRKCKPRDVTLHLKASSYPVISPENITFPKNFLDQRFKTYDLNFQSDEVQQHIVVEGPLIGNWFAVAFLSWSDPNNDRIEQQGLTASCETLLLAELSVTRFQPIIMNSGQMHNATLVNYRFSKPKQSSNAKDDMYTVKGFNSNANVSLNTTERAQKQFRNNNITNECNRSTANNETVYKFFVPANFEVVEFCITILEACVRCPNLEFHIKANAYPNTPSESNDYDNNYYTKTIIKPNQTGEVLFELYVQSNSWHYAVLKFAQQKGCEWLNVNVTNSLSYSLEIDFHESFNNSANSEAVKALPKESAATMKSATIENAREHNISNSSKPDMKEKLTNAWQPLRFRDMELYPLLRQTYREFFMFDYDLVPDENGTVPTFLNLTAGVPAAFTFELGDVYDIGGTLTFAVSMRNSLKDSTDLKTMPTVNSVTERSGILAEKLIGGPTEASATSEGDDDDEDDTSLPHSNQTIIVCMNLAEPGEPIWPDKCRYGRKLLPASSVVNNTDSNTSTGLIHVPFPESGQWYITMGLYCHGAETAARITIIDSVKDFVRKHVEMLTDMEAPCACANETSRYKACISDHKCIGTMNETETLKIKECLMDSKCTHRYDEMTRKFEVHHKIATEQHFGVENCNTSVVFTISSSPCVAGRCGRFGRCYHYMSGGFVFSTCVCIKGYRGWDCTEDSEVPSSLSILVASLLLTLSNLLFFPSIYMAVRRKYYTEATIYFFAMFFSIFYHACDSGEDEYSFCLVKIGVLQFCDFYCGLLAIWVTLVAMSHLRPQFVSLLHMFGAILLAFGTELNKQSLWVFLAPALTGICIISASWGLRCYKSHKWFPAKKYLTIYMPLGIVLVMTGLVCYAFLQTKQNYHIVHSIWHMLMACSILCLLPSRNSFIPKC